MAAPPHEPSKSAPTGPAPSGEPKPFPGSLTGRIVWILFAVGLVSFLFLCVWTCATKHSRRLKQAMRNEARVVIASIRSAEEAYRAEASTYLSTSDRGENDFYPASSSEPRQRPFDPQSDRKPLWSALGASLPSKSLYCGYVVISGSPGSLQGAGPRGRALFGGHMPQKPWYYIRAHCGLGGSAKLIFETTSESTKIYEGGKTRR